LSKRVAKVLDHKVRSLFSAPRVEKSLDPAG
jgi:hypothetical protein